MKKPQVHVCQFSDRIIRVTVRETKDAIFFELWFSQIAPWPPGGMEQFKTWFYPISLPYDNDPRPNVMVNTMTGEKCAIYDCRLL